MGLSASPTGPTESSGSSESPRPGSGIANKLGPLGNVRLGAITVAVLIGVLWVVEAIDTVVSHRLDRFGVRPHRIAGLRGIAFAPFLHANWQHLIGNTVPLAVLAMIVAARSVARFVSVAVIVGIVSGLGMWLLGSSNEVHIGASGIVFGLLTYVIARGFFARQFGMIVIGIIVGAIYGSILSGVLPSNRGVSWQGHLFGAIGGVLAAYLLDRRGSRGSRRGSSRRNGSANPDQ
jgi:membrane associated rhomboid family serine protease